MFCLRRIPLIFKISTFFTLLFMTLSGSAVHSADVILIWDKPNDARVTGYKVFYGFAGSNFKSVPKKIINSPDQTSCNINDLKAGNTYGFAAKSFDKNGNESVFSEVIFYDFTETQAKNYSDDDSNDKSVNDGNGGCFIRMVSDLNTRD